MTPGLGNGWQLLLYRTLGMGWLLQHWLHDCTFNILTSSQTVCSNYCKAPIKFDFALGHLQTVHPDRMLTTARQAQKYGTFLRPARTSSMEILCPGGGGGGTPANFG